MRAGGRGEGDVGRKLLAFGLEVFGEDVVRLQRFREAVDLLFHVRPDKPFQIVDEIVGSPVELLVETLEEMLSPSQNFQA